jgi:hypothetical protein
MATRKQRRPARAAPNNAVSVPRYFLNANWLRRLDGIVASATSSEGRDFATANANLVRQKLTLEKSLRVVFNLGGYALLSYLRSDDYQNVYEEPVIFGVRRTPSQTRIDADSLVGLQPAKDYYFCALATGGTGIRFYGEYCVVICAQAAKDAVEKILDRNSWDLLVEPLKGYLATLKARPKSPDLIRGLMSKLTDGSAQDMLTAKVLQHTPHQPRLLTAGAIANAILSDEDYCEAYYRGKIKLKVVEEVREHAADVSNESQIVRRLQGGESVRCEELVWATRRRMIRRHLASRGIPRSVPADSGRSGRWS